MGIFGGSKENSEFVLVFDIGSSSVGGALFYMEQSGIPKIIFAVREPITLEADIEPDRFLSLTIKALETVANKVSKAGVGAPKRIFCVLSSPWYVSQNRIIKLEKNSPFVFTIKLADDLIQKEIELFEADHITKYSQAGSPVRAIELKNIKTMLNGYETSQPLNQKTKELEMTIFISMSPESVLSGIEQAIQKHLHFKAIKFSSFAMVSFAVVRDMYPGESDFLLMDIGGEMTDISMVKKNIFRESISFPIGVNFIIRGVSSALGCSIDEAQSLIYLFNDGHAEEGVVERVGLVIKELKEVWLKKFQESLANLSHDISIPATIFMAVHKDLAEFFSQTMKTEQFNQYTLTESKFKIHFLGTASFHTMAVFKDTAVRDSFLIIDSIYINRFLHKQ
jgi:cell division ATPase FtsA